MKRAVKIITLVMLVVMMLSVFAACQHKIVEGNKNITVTVVYKDKSSDVFEISTQKNYLADALVEQKLVEYAEDGYYTTVGGVTADYSVDKGWWCLTKDGQMTTEGLNTQPIADGDVFELTYTIG